MNSNILRVGTDCSGIEAPIQALKNLGINFKHIFSSETDKYCIESIKANYNPEIIYNDMTNRELKNLPDIDLYVCGFPCQAFSSAGKRKGFKDKRGNIFFECLDVIEYIQPKIFILENVKGLLNHNNGKTWEIIQEELDGISDIYNIYYKVLNTKDYGIPQNRERIFIIGIKIENQTKIFNCPEKKKMKNIKTFVDNKNKEYKKTQRSHKHKIKPNNVFIDFNFLKTNNFVDADKWAPCLNTQNGLWCVQYHRYATCKERLKLQGFPTNFKQVVSDTQFNKQIGNSMSVNVLECVLNECFDCVKLF